MAGLRIMDTTIRDGQQSLWATRMTTAEMLPILPKMDQVGYWAIEAWGGATFDSCLRFLDEDPWERLRLIKERCPNTPLAMLVRGQNLVGYKHYSTDVVERFIERAHANGIDIFRVFDALNDIDNIRDCAAAIKKVGAHLNPRSRIRGALSTRSTTTLPTRASSPSWALIRCASKIWPAFWCRIVLPSL